MTTTDGNRVAGAPAPNDSVAVAADRSPYRGATLLGSDSLRRLASLRIVWFAAIGAASTALYLLLYIVLAPLLPLLIANGGALLLSAVANTAANRRFTFGVRGRTDAGTHHALGLAVFALGLVFTSAALALLHHVSNPSRGQEVCALVAANLVVTGLRFVALRWMFGERAITISPQPSDPDKVDLTSTSKDL